MVTLNSVSTAKLIELKRRIREKWRTMPYPENDRWPNEKLYDLICNELKNRKECEV